MTENEHLKAREVPTASATPATAALPGAEPPARPAAAGAAGAAPGADFPVADSAAAAGPASPGATASSAAPAKPAGSKIKIDMPASGAPEPMRPATRMPKLPSEPHAAAKSGSAVPAEPSMDSAGAAAGRTVPAAAGSPAPAANTGPVANSAPAPDAERDVFVEESPTTMLQVRPPQEEVDRRLAAREQAANTKPVLPRVFQVLMAVFYPVVLLVLAIRLVTTNAFLWIEYHRPGFPADSFGFSTDDRLTYGSYTVDYLLNFAGRRYLGGLVNTEGKPLFLDREVAHMADVKSLIDLAFLLGLVLAIVMVIGIIYLSRRSTGGVRRGLFAGSIVTLVLIIGLGVLAVMGWETFFTDFHKIFFANGTWTFYTDDTLIRLFPSQFWSDAGIFIGAFVLVVSSLTLAFTWPTKDRRQAVARAKRPGRRAAAQ